MAAEVKLPEKIVIHGYLNLDSQKISKSLGNIIKPNEMVSWFGVDASRYLILNMCQFGSDGDIRIEDFYTKYNADLANNYGNLVSRTLKMVERNLGGKLPSPEKGEMPEIIKAGYEMIRNLRDKLVDVQIKAATDEIIFYLNRLNAYFDEQKPWVLAKEKKNDELGRVLYNVSYGLSLATAVLSPYLTKKTETVIESLFGLNIMPARILKELGNALDFSDSIKMPKENLFPRLDMPKDLRVDTSVHPQGNLITIDDFGKVELRVAEIMEAEKVPKADKLLKLQIEIGEERRQIVAGIAEYYQPEGLVGKKIIVVINLLPAKLRGIESNGMLLAAKKKDRLTLLTVDSDIPSGAKIS